MPDPVETTIEPANETVAPDARAGARVNWGRAIFFFLLGFLLLAEPLMLILLLYQNGTLQF